MRIIELTSHLASLNAPLPQMDAQSKALIRKRKPWASCQKFKEI